MKKFLSYFLIAALICFIFFRNCPGESHPTTDSIETKTDTVWVPKVIPGDTSAISQSEFVPEKTYSVDSILRLKIAKLKDDNARLYFLLDEMKTKVYDTTYHFDRGSVRVKDSIQGNLLGRDLKFMIDDFQYQEKTITNTTTKKMYPKWAVSVGITTGAQTDFNFVQNPFLGAEIGIRNAKGYTLELGYNTEKQVHITLSKTLFVNY